MNHSHTHTNANLAKSDYDLCVAGHVAADSAAAGLDVCGFANAFGHAIIALLSGSQAPETNDIIQQLSDIRRHLKSTNRAQRAPIRRASFKSPARRLRIVRIFLSYHSIRAQPP